eukprot:CAMPEP_0170515444 /NCGR_PEP_ID=MMETSP0209-20121228/1875_1 /TAXON_ID=665100 ORGANISM="Litonotus pictus, Strain P1" /NCGR_SAMPLE_ID=MMETSP0209 /ASSEMBLY_ACC=CAM_ASM_000301 /LENGTH=1468 /DNA_ID=CAMNT_0010799937 /DNA_START=284 /DNA_END=4687 /DNA_ORIENTATION=+
MTNTCAAASGSGTILITNNDGGICTSTCNDKSKCFKTTDGKCYATADGQLGDLAGGACSATCGTDKCYNKETYLCHDLVAGVLVRDTVGATHECECVVKTECVHRTTTKCVLPSFDALANGDGKMCTKTCSTTATHCFLPALDGAKEAYVCYAADSTTRLGNGDGSMCSNTNCKDVSKCYQTSNHVCVDPTTTSTFGKGDGGECGNCVTGECPNPTTKLCQKPSSALLYLANTQDCSQTTCLANGCLQPKLFECYDTSSGTYDHLKDVTVTGEDCACVAADECLDPDASTCLDAAARIARNLVSDGDGSYCKVRCSNKDFCFNPHTNNCVDMYSRDGEGKATDQNLKTLANDVGGACYCATDQATKCVDNDSAATCVVATSGKVVDGDGSYCKTACSDKNRCFKDNVCQLPEISTLIADGAGGECANDTCPASKCYDPTTGVCISPKSGNAFASNTSPAACVTACTGKCINPFDFKCISLTGGDGGTGICTCSSATQCVTASSSPSCTARSSSSVSVIGETMCLTKCPRTHCYSKNTNFCYDLTDSSLAYYGTVNANEEGGDCLCIDKTKCLTEDSSTSPYLSCVAPNSDPKIADTQGGLCLTSCSSGKCYQTSNYTCMSPTNVLVAPVGGGECQADSNCTTSCYNPILFRCENTGFANTGTTNQECACTSGECIDPTTGVCLDPDSVDDSKNYIKSDDNTSVCRLLSEGCKASTHCILTLSVTGNANYRDCITKPSNTDARTGTYECYCTDTTKCMNLANANACEAGSGSKVIDGDGSSCKTVCSDNSKCFSPTTGVCLVPGDNYMEVTSTGEGCTCTDKNKCIDSSGFCVNPSSSNVANGDGGACVTACSDPEMCFDGTTYICQKGDATHIVNSDAGAQCETSCQVALECYHPITFKCMSNTGTDLEGTGGVCSCTDASNKCIDPNGPTCLAPGLRSTGKTYLLGVYGTTSECITKCVDDSQCYDDLAFQCKAASDGKVSNNDGGECQASCSDTSKCYNTSFQCVSPDKCHMKIDTPNTCQGFCPVDYCLHPDEVHCLAFSTTFTKEFQHCFCDDVSKCIDGDACVDPSDGKFSNKDGGLCLSSCPSGTCSHPALYSCVPVVGGTLEREVLTGKCYCANTTTHCVSTTAESCHTLVSNDNFFSEGDGGLCKQDDNDTAADTFICSNKNMCWNSNQTCQTPSSGNYSKSDGGACVSSCGAGKCFHPGTFFCIDEDSGVNGLLGWTQPEIDASGGSLVSGDLGKCHCVSEKQCIDQDSLKCIFGQEGKLVNSDSGLCTSTCSNTDYCFDYNFICVPGGYQRIVNDASGAACTTSCNTSSKCYNPKDYKCQDTTGFSATTTGSMCTCTDGSNCVYASDGNCAAKGDGSACAYKEWYERIWLIDIKNDLVIDTKNVNYYYIGEVKSNAAIDSSFPKATLMTGNKVSVYRYIQNNDPTNDTTGDSAYEKYLPNIYGYRIKTPFVAFDFEIW